VYESEQVHKIVEQGWVCLFVGLIDWGNTKAKEEEKEEEEKNKKEKKKKDGGWGCGSWVGCCKSRWICFSIPKDSYAIGGSTFLRGLV